MVLSQYYYFKSGLLKFMAGDPRKTKIEMTGNPKSLKFGEYLQIADTFINFKNETEPHVTRKKIQQLNKLPLFIFVKTDSNQVSNMTTNLENIFIFGVLFFNLVSKSKEYVADIQSKRNDPNVLVLSRQIS